MEHYKRYSSQASDTKSNASTFKFWSFEATSLVWHNHLRFQPVSLAKLTFLWRAANQLPYCKALHFVTRFKQHARQHLHKSTKKGIYSTGLLYAESRGQVVGPKPKSSVYKKLKI